MILKCVSLLKLCDSLFFLVRPGPGQSLISIAGGMPHVNKISKACANQIGFVLIHITLAPKRPRYTEVLGMFHSNRQQQSVGVRPELIARQLLHFQFLLAFVNAA